MLLLRRPFGIADVKDKSITVFYRVLGEGTKALTSVKSGDLLNVLGPLGNGFKTDAKRPLLVGGGMGLAPLLYLARFYQGKADILMGGRNKQEIFWEEYFRPYANNIFITTDDGSVGTKGFTTNLLPQLLTDTKYDLVAVCGPGIMMQLISDIAAKYDVPCQVSLEKRMACGLGACLSCAVDTKDGQRKKVCKDGPVFQFYENVAGTGHPNVHIRIGGGYLLGEPLSDIQRDVFFKSLLVPAYTSGILAAMPGVDNHCLQSYVGVFLLGRHGDCKNKRGQNGCYMATEGWLHDSLVLKIVE